MWTAISTQTKLSLYFFSNLKLFYLLL